MQKKNAKNGQKPEAELFGELIAEISENKENHVFQQLNSDGELEVVVIVLEPGMIWYSQNPEILLIDGTYKTNTENFILFVFLIQNSQLKGLPVAFAFMRLVRIYFFFTSLYQVRRAWNTEHRISVLQYNRLLIKKSLIIALF
jgi:hypothetical protein